MKRKCLVRLLHKEVAGCNGCPAYSFHEDNDLDFAHHDCNLGACGFPNHVDLCGLPVQRWDKPLPEGVFATDGPDQGRRASGSKQP